MPYYRSVGEVPRKRHTQFKQPDGTLYREELMGTEGFSADSALLYHRHSPSDVLTAEAWEIDGDHGRPNHPLVPRLLQTHELDVGGDAVTGRRLLADNADVRISYVAADQPSPLYRNAIGDELYFVESGIARCESVFGVLEVGPGDYVVMPTSTTHRWVPTAEGEPTRLLIVESRGTIRAPRRYVSDRGQFLEHSPYCERDLRSPEAPLLDEGDSVEVLVRHHTGGTRYVCAKHPFDVVGWDGCLYPYAFNVADFEPISGRIHQPPPTFQTFEGPNFVICSFVPHKAEYHPDAVIVPYHHANVDSDELMFYGDGGRGGHGITEGSITWHPAGFVHGPHIDELEMSTAMYNDGLVDIKPLNAVMIDTFRPLNVAPDALAVDDPGYLSTWRTAITSPTRGAR
ncbi:homogentisate 1,2-dioxygenase [Nocardia sp. NPDC057663]|uniref:homogentisate 1,2-dioxygenase n=1 Tax=Nocardia sp. NPDC057663 TaxID=3346201 RepID=UPI003671C256